jgi:hypothetical protein
MEIRENEDWLVERLVNLLWVRGGQSHLELTAQFPSFMGVSSTYVYLLLEELVDMGLLVKKYGLYYLG